MTKRKKPTIVFLLDKEVAQLTKLSKTTRWRLEKAGDFPKARRISHKRVIWIESEILEWMLSKQIA